MASWFARFWKPVTTVFAKFCVARTVAFAKPVILMGAMWGALMGGRGPRSGRGCALHIHQ